MKKSNVDYTKAESITFVNNGILFLFDSIKYLLSSNEIESVNNPGTISNIIGVAKYSAAYSPGLLQCWAQDTSNAAANTNKGFEKRQKNFVGSFCFAVPLIHIFGFAENYNKVLYSFVHTLVLTQSSSDDNALFRKTDEAYTNANVADGIVNLTNIRWKLPCVSPSDLIKYELHKQVKTKTILTVGFWMRQCITTTLPNSTRFAWRLGVRKSPEQPRYIFLAFQTNRSEDQEKIQQRMIIAD